MQKWTGIPRESPNGLADLASMGARQFGVVATGDARTHLEKTLSLQQPPDIDPTWQSGSAVLFDHGPEGVSIRIHGRGCAIVRTRDSTDPIMLLGEQAREFPDVVSCVLVAGTSMSSDECETFASWLERGVPKGAFDEMFADWPEHGVLFIGASMSEFEHEETDAIFAFLEEAGQVDERATPDVVRRLARPVTSEEDYPSFPPHAGEPMESFPPHAISESLIRSITRDVAMTPHSPRREASSDTDEPPRSVLPSDIRWPASPSKEHAGNEATIPPPAVLTGSRFDQELGELVRRSIEAAEAINDDDEDPAERVDDATEPSALRRTLTPPRPVTSPESEDRFSLGPTLSPFPTPTPLESTEGGRASAPTAPRKQPKTSWTTAMVLFTGALIFGVLMTLACFCGLRI